MNVVIAHTERPLSLLLFARRTSARQMPAHHQSRALHVRRQRAIPRRRAKLTFWSQRCLGASLACSCAYVRPAQHTRGPTNPFSASTLTTLQPTTGSYSLSEFKLINRREGNLSWLARERESPQPEAKATYIHIFCWLDLHDDTI